MGDEVGKAVTVRWPTVQLTKPSSIGTVNAALCVPGANQEGGGDSGGLATPPFVARLFWAPYGICAVSPAMF